MVINNTLFNIFGQSPIKPLQKHIQVAHAAVELLLPFIEAVYLDDWEKANQLQKRISDYEREADQLKKDLRLHLPKGFLLPVARSDLLELLTNQDRIANKAEDIAGLVLGRKMQIPASLREDYRAFLSRCINASEQAKQAIGELDELLETGFSGNEVAVVEKMICQLDDIEHDTDKQQCKLRATLFAIETTLPPIEVIFLYQLFQRTGDLADRAQTVGGRLQLLLAR